ncbi:MAG: helix-turn-helix domain-containing protein [Hyphomicrobiaceae bacterium]
MNDRARRLIIRELREAAKLDQKALADALGLSVSQYSRKERHPERFRGPELITLAAVLGVGSDQLLDDASHPGISMASFRRTVPVQQLTNRSRTHVAPTSDVSTMAYAIEMKDGSLEGGRRPICKGDYCIIDPSVPPSPGKPVHALDPATGEHIIRLFSPLHPTNPRAPGFLLKATAPEFDDIFIKAEQADHIKGSVVEVHFTFA